VNKGAEIITGGKRVGDKGYYYKPTILKNITNKMKIYYEEIFGPVASIVVVEDEKDAIKLANESVFGLGASIWTKNFDKAEQFSKDIESGMVSVNHMSVSDPRVPFGGIKQSGFGRELSKYGMLEFVNVKSIRFYDKILHHHYVE